MTGPLATGPSAGAAAADGANGTVLVVEDDPGISRAIRAVLESGGLGVLTAADGRAGLRSFHAARPALVLLDIGLPGLDGWAVLDRIRDLSEVPVLRLRRKLGPDGADRRIEAVRGFGYRYRRPARPGPP
jgi:DNA-binding response OmpR family regulator